MSSNPRYAIQGAKGDEILVKVVETCVTKVPTPDDGVGIVIVATVVGLVTVVNRDSSASETNPSGDSPLFGPIDDGFVRRYLGTESPSSNEYGVVFEVLKTGRSEFWNVPSRHPTDPSSVPLLRYEVDRTSLVGPAVILRARPPILIADRKSGLTYGFNSQEWRLLLGPEGRLGPSEEGFLVAHRDRVSFAVVDMTKNPTRVARMFSLPVDLSGQRTAITNGFFLDGSTLLLTSTEAGAPGNDFMVGEGQAKSLLFPLWMRRKSAFRRVTGTGSRYTRCRLAMPEPIS